MANDSRKCTHVLATIVALRAFATCLSCSWLLNGLLKFLSVGSPQFLVSVGFVPASLLSTVTAVCQVLVSGGFSFGLLLLVPCIAG